MKKLFMIAVGMIVLSPLAAGSALALSCNNCVDSGDIINGQVKAADIATNAVGSSEIATNAVKSSEIATNAVKSSEIATNAVGNSELQDYLDYIGVSQLFAGDIFQLGESVTIIYDDTVPLQPATATLVPAFWSQWPLAPFTRIDCQDPDGCDVTLDGLTSYSGFYSVITNGSANNVQFSDLGAGTAQNLVSTANLGLDDTITVIGEGIGGGTTTTWLEVARSDN